MPHNEARDRDIADAIERGESLASIGRRYGISRQRVRQIGLKLGARFGYRMSEDEAAQIVAQYRRGVRPAHIETHRSQRTVCDVLIRAGVYRPNPGASLWTPREDEILAREWGKKSSREIGALIGKSRNAVIGRAYRLRLAEAAHA